MSRASAHPSLREAQEQLSRKKLTVEGKGSSSFFLAVLASVQGMIDDLRGTRPSWTGWWRGKSGSSCGSCCSMSCSWVSSCSTLRGRSSASCS